jgi:hypothetical protein
MYVERAGRLGDAAMFLYAFHDGISEDRVCGGFGIWFLGHVRILHTRRTDATSFGLILFFLKVLTSDTVGPIMLLVTTNEGAKTMPLPKWFREGHCGDLACPHRDVSCCDACHAKHAEIVNVGGQAFWIADPTERRELRTMAAARMVERGAVSP